jgi:hypothetical protein
MSDQDVGPVDHIPFHRIAPQAMVLAAWLFPPYKWAFGAVAATPAEAFTRVLARRLLATRIRLITRAGHSAAVH